MADESLGAMVRRHRHRASLTIAGLAQASGVSARTISDLERGNSLVPQRATVTLLADALGLDPDDRSALLTAASAARTGSVPLGVTEPPRPMADFLGRDAELASLDPADPLIVVTGPGGVGKTSLVVEFARRNAGQFPAGVHFVDLRGMDERPLGSGEALARLLRGFGVASHRIPDGTRARAAAYRDLMGSRRALVVLDNAADEAQLKQLLPDKVDGLTLVTSRRSLAGMGGTHLALEPLASDEAARLFDSILNHGGYDHRVPEPAAVAQVTQACGNLPIALRVAANRLLSRPAWSVRDLVARLDDADRRLDQLAAGELTVSAVFAMSYRQLSAQAALVFRRLALVPGPDTGLELAAVAAGQTADDTEAAVAELIELGLLEPRVSGRYQFHDLVRLYARRVLGTSESGEQRQAARDHMHAWLLRTAVTSAQPFDPETPTADGQPVDLEAAQAWLMAESENWYEAMRAAEESGERRTVLDVAQAMHWFSDRWNHWSRWEAVYTMGRVAAVGLNDRSAEAAQLSHLCWVYTTQGQRFEQALGFAEEAAQVARGAGDLRQEAWSLTYAARCLMQLGRWADGRESAARAVRAFEDTTDVVGLAQALIHAGGTARETGRLDEAVRAHRRVLALTEQSAMGADTDRLTRSVALMELGVDLEGLGHHDEAAEQLRAGVDIAIEVGVPIAIAFSSWRLGQTLCRRGPSEEGEAALRRAAGIYRDLGEPDLADKALAQITVRPPSKASTEPVA